MGRVRRLERPSQDDRQRGLAGPLVFARRIGAAARRSSDRGPCPAGVSLHLVPQVPETTASSAADRRPVPSTRPVSRRSQPSPPSSTAPAAPVKISATPLGKRVINPTTPITVTAANGTLRAVKLVNPEGKHVTGACSADKTSWHTTEVLGYSKIYRLTAKATELLRRERRQPQAQVHDADAEQHDACRTSTNIYGGYLKNGATYGVGMIPVVNFDEAITGQGCRREGAARHDQPARRRFVVLGRRPHGALASQNFYQPGTKVTHRREGLRRRRGRWTVRPGRPAASRSRSVASTSRSPNAEDRTR